MKKQLFFVVFLAGLHYAAAQDVRLTTNRLDGIYSKGDTVRVYGRCADVAGANLTMEIKVGGITRETGTIHLTDEFREIHTEICDSTKWVAVLVHTADDKVIDIGYMVNPEDIRPGYKTPWDLRCYWKREISKMRRSEMTVKVDTVEAYKDYIGKVICWHVELSMHDGFPVNAYVSIPIEASGPDGYPHYAPVFDEYRPGIRDYSLSWAAGSYKLIISGPRVYVDFYAGDSRLLSKRFILR